MARTTEPNTNNLFNERARVALWYQKGLKDHGINVRPDLIIHVPAGPGGNVRANNFAVFELNHQAGPKEVAEDFANLDTVVGVLNYPLAIFLNVASGQTQARHYRGPFRDRLHCIAVRHSAAGIQIRHARFAGDNVIEGVV